MLSTDLDNCCNVFIRSGERDTVRLLRSVVRNVRGVLRAVIGGRGKAISKSTRQFSARGCGFSARVHCAGMLPPAERLVQDLLTSLLLPSSDCGRAEDLETPSGAFVICAKL